MIEQEVGKESFACQEKEGAKAGLETWNGTAPGVAWYLGWPGTGV